MKKQESLAHEAAEPLYAQLAERLRSQILAGVYKPGDRIPTEAQLIAAYNVSITTVRRALSDLVAERLIARRSRIGSVVRAPAPALTSRRTITCLNLSSLAQSELADDSVKAMFERDNPEWELKFRTLSDQSWPLVTHQIESADIVMAHPGWFERWIERGNLLDLNVFVEQLKRLATRDLFPAALVPFARDGRLFGLPQMCNPTLLYCNNRLFKKAGIELNRLNWTWATLLATIRRVSRSGIIGLGYFPYAATWWEPFVIQAGGRLMDARTHSFLPDTEAALTALAFAAKLGHMTECVVNLNARSDALDLIRNDRVAMVFSGPYMNRLIGDGLEHWTVFCPPGRPAPASVAVSYGLGISRFTREPLMSWRFVELYSGIVGQLALGRTLHALPAHRQAAADTFVKGPLQVNNKQAFIEAAENARALPGVLYDPMVHAMLMAEYDRWMRGAGKPAELLKHWRSCIPARQNRDGLLEQAG